MSARNNARKAVPAAETPARRTTTARATAAKKTAPVAAAPAPVASHSIETLAANATVAKEMPKTSRAGGTKNPFVPLLEKSKSERNAAMELPAVPNDAIAKSVVLAVRRAARILGYGVTVRQTTTAAGIVITFAHKPKK